MSCDTDVFQVQKIGLATVYRQEGPVRELITRVLALPMIPLHQIPANLTLLEGDADRVTEELFSYVV